jgi:Zn-dependent protease
MAVELSLEDLTPDAQAALRRAAQQAQGRGMAQIEPAHILLGLLEDRKNLAADTLQALQIDPQVLVDQVQATLPSGGQISSPVTPTLSPAGQQNLRAAFKEATHLGDKRVDAVHLLVGLVHSPESPLYRLLSDNGLSLYALRQHLLSQPRQFRERHRDSLQANLRPSPIFLGLVAIFAASGVWLWSGPGQALAGPITTVFVLSGWICAVCIHEFGHAICAYWGGDVEVGRAGYLTLNPLRYSHPVLSIIFPVLILLIGGIGLPGGAVYIRPGAMRSRGWQMLSAAGGPLGTILFTLLIVLPFVGNWQDRISDANRYFWPALGFLALLQVHVLLFNLLPIPPLDGFNILAPWLPYGIQERARMLGGLGFFLIFMLFQSNNPLTENFWRATIYLADRLQIPLQIAAMGYQQFAWWR